MNKVDQLLNSLRELSKAHKRLLKGIPDVRSAEEIADKKLEQVIEHFEDPEIEKKLNNHIQNVRHDSTQKRNDIISDDNAQREELIVAETDLMQNVGVSKKDIEDLYRLCQKMSKNNDKLPTNTDEIIQGITNVHKSIKLQLNDVRKQKRKIKKIRKRNIAQGMTSAIFGTGIIVANTKAASMFAFSYSLGCSALHQALRDFVGKSQS